MSDLTEREWKEKHLRTLEALKEFFVLNDLDSAEAAAKCLHFVVMLTSNAMTFDEVKDAFKKIWDAYE